MNNDFDTWLTGDDVQRLWDVCHGVLPQTAATEDELNEFKKLVLHAAMIKQAGPDYLEHTVH